MIVVSWNVRDLLRECLISAQGSIGVRLRIVVIDNDSSDGSAEMVAKDFPNVHLIRNRDNRGFAAAVNQGIAVAETSSDIVLVNPDACVQPSTFERLAQTLDVNARAGIAGPKILYPDGHLQPSVKRFPRWRDLWLTLSKLPNLWPQLSRRYQAFDLRTEISQPVDQVMGSCFYIRRRTLNEVGLFDEGFWIWYEEVDFSLRAKRLGWDSWYVAEAVAYHGRGRSFVQLSARQKQAYLRKSIAHYSAKHFGRIPTVGLWPVMFVSWLSAVIIDAFDMKKPIQAKEL